MKIANIMAGAKVGGAELFFERFNSALAELKDFSVLPIIRQDKARADRLRTENLTPKELSFGGPLDFITRFRLRKLLNEYKPDVVMAWMSRAAMHTPKGDWTLIARLGGYYDLGYYKNCDHLVGNTQDIVDWIISEGWPSDRAHYLPNFCPDFSKATVFRPSTIPKDAKLILTAGRLHTDKAFDVLIKALSYLPKAHLLIVGEGPERSSLELQASALSIEDRVHMPGWSQEMPSLFAACDIFVCPSRIEPLGNVVIEAFSAGKPIVAAASKGPKVLISDEQSGLLAPLENAEILAQQIERVLNDPQLAERLSKVARLEFEQKYAKKPVMARWVEFLEKI